MDLNRKVHLLIRGKVVMVLTRTKALAKKGRCLHLREFYFKPVSVLNACYLKPGLCVGSVRQRVGTSSRASTGLMALPTRQRV